MLNKLAAAAGRQSKLRAGLCGLALLSAGSASAGGALYDLNVHVSGLAQNDSVTFSFSDPASHSETHDSLTNGDASFPDLDDGSTYSFTVEDPDGYTCDVTNGTGTVSANSPTITVACTEDEPPPLPPEDNDTDGVDDATEDGVPNIGGVGTGDGNDDGMDDSAQSNVASLKTFDGLAYLTVVGPSMSSQHLSDVSAIDTPNDFPTNVIAPYGGINVTSSTLPMGATGVVFTLYMPYNPDIGGVMKYNSTTHVYTLLTPTTPDQFVAITHLPAGSATPTTTKITWLVLDGGDLDDDGLENKIIVDPAFPVVIPPVGPVLHSSAPSASISGGAFGWLTVLPMSLVALLRRRSYDGRTTKGSNNMVNKPIRRGVLALLATLGVAQSAQATDFYGDVMGSVVRRDTDLPFKTGYGAQVAVGAPLTGNLDWEVGGYWHRNDLGSLPGHVDSEGLNAGVRYLLGGDAVRPFLLGGLGVQRENFKQVGNDYENSPFLDLGFGALARLSDSLGLRAELRTHVLSYNSYPSSNIAFDYRFNLGLEFGGRGRSGSAAAAPAAAPVAQKAPAAAPAASKGPAAAAAPMPSHFVLKGVNFETASDKLTAQSKPVLDGVANTLQAQPGVNISIDGYTDNRGDAKRNVDLSQRRAKSVMDYLVSKGVDAKRLSAQGHGADSPIDSNKTSAGRANNRRVELNVK